MVNITSRNAGMFDTEEQRRTGTEGGKHTNEYTRREDIIRDR